MFDRISVPEDRKPTQFELEPIEVDSVTLEAIRRGDAFPLPETFMRNEAVRKAFLAHVSALSRDQKQQLMPAINKYLGVVDGADRDVRNEALAEFSTRTGKTSALLFRGGIVTGTCALGSMLYPGDEHLSAILLILTYALGAAAQQLYPMEVINLAAQRDNTQILYENMRRDIYNAIRDPDS